jgi:hypothetical protein
VDQVRERNGIPRLAPGPRSPNPMMVTGHCDNNSASVSRSPGSDLPALKLLTGHCRCRDRAQQQRAPATFVLASGLALAEPACRVRSNADPAESWWHAVMALSAS